MATPGYAVLLDFLSVRHVVSAFVDESIRPSGINGGDFAVYALLAGLGPQTPQRLARIMGIPATTLSSQARRLEDRGHVRRLPHGRDGRSHLLELTAEGRATHRDAARLFLDAYGALEHELPADVDDIRVALRLLEDAARRVMGADRSTAYQVEAATGDGTRPGPVLARHFRIEPRSSVLDESEEEAVARALAEPGED